MGGWLRNVPNEVLEGDVPVVVEEYRYRRGSGGAGAWRGGDGLVVTMRSRADGVTFAVRGLERLLYQPWGVLGGEPGASGRATLNPGTPYERDLGRVGTITLSKGDVLRIETPGGGGLGDPPGATPTDVARRAGGFADPPARFAAPGTADALTFALGPARTAADEHWPQPLQRQLVDRVRSEVPLAAQPRVYRQLYLAIEEAAGGGPVLPGHVADALAGAGLAAAS
jgi:N-methylhydantoinase B